MLIPYGKVVWTVWMFTSYLLKWTHKEKLVAISSKINEPSIVIIMLRCWNTKLKGANIWQKESFYITRAHIPPSRPVITLKNWVGRSWCFLHTVQILLRLIFPVHITKRRLTWKSICQQCWSQRTEQKRLRNQTK